MRGIFLSFEAKRIRQKISSYCCHVLHAIVVCVHEIVTLATVILVAVQMLH